VDGDKIKDWKSSSRGPYQPWEYKRWALQPTVYSWALAQADGYSSCKPEFEYVVMFSPTKRAPEGVQRFSVERGPEHYEWLKTKCTDIAQLIEVGLDSWPKNDNHALCSEKWCPAWDNCKGKSGITF
jgi:hypothetical protein